MKRLLVLVWLVGCGGGDAKQDAGPPIDADLPDAQMPVVCAREVAAGGSHTCARELNGTVSCWGWNANGELGVPSASEQTRNRPGFVPAQMGAKGLALGKLHSCAIQTDTVSCWGSNDHGQLGGGSIGPEAPAPTSVALAGVAALTAGDAHTCALETDGTIWCWGAGTDGQLGDGGGVDRAAPVQVSTIADAVSIGAGAAHTCAARADGSVWCWGKDDRGQLGDMAGGMKQVSPVPVGGLTMATTVAAGGAHTCATRMDGGVWCWGDNSKGELGADTAPATARVSAAPSGVTSGAIAVALGAEHSCSLQSDMTLRCWGANGSGQLGSGSATMPYSIAPIIVVNIGDATQVTAGTNWTCALRGTASVWCWGDDTLGFLGDGANTASPAPVKTIPCGN